MASRSVHSEDIQFVAIEISMGVSVTMFGNDVLMVVLVFLFLLADSRLEDQRHQCDLDNVISLTPLFF